MTINNASVTVCASSFYAITWCKCFLMQNTPILMQIFAYQQMKVLMKIYFITMSHGPIFLGMLSQEIQIEMIFSSFNYNTTIKLVAMNTPLVILSTF